MIAETPEMTRAKAEEKYESGRKRFSSADKADKATQRSVL